MDGVWITGGAGDEQPTRPPDNLLEMACDGVIDALSYMGEARDILSVLAIWLATRPKDDPLRRHFREALENLERAKSALHYAQNVIGPRYEPL